MMTADLRYRMRCRFLRGNSHCQEDGARAVPRGIDRRQVAIKLALRAEPSFPRSPGSGTCGRIFLLAFSRRAVSGIVGMSHSTSRNRPPGRSVYDETSELRRQIPQLARCSRGQVRSFVKVVTVFCACASGLARWARWFVASARDNLPTGETYPPDGKLILRAGQTVPSGVQAHSSRRPHASVGMSGHSQRGSTTMSALQGVTSARPDHSHARSDDTARCARCFRRAARLFRATAT